MNLIEREESRNRRIAVLGVIMLPVTLCLLLGVWWVIILEYAVSAYFFTAVAVSVVITYGIAWILRGKTSNSIGLQIHMMTKAETMVHMAMLIDHLRDEYKTQVDYKVGQIEDKSGES